VREGDGYQDKKEYGIARGDPTFVRGIKIGKLGYAGQSGHETK